MKKGIVLVIMTAMLVAVGAQAQETESVDKYLELLRSDIKTQRVAIVTEVMQFSQEQADIFWPLYKEYEFELGKLGDERVALIKAYAENYETMTDEKAEELMKQAFKLDDNLLKLDKSYFKKFNKVLPTKTVAKFFQLQNQIDLMIDLQISANLPFIE